MMSTYFEETQYPGMCFSDLNSNGNMLTHPHQPHQAPSPHSEKMLLPVTSMTLTFLPLSLVL
jgi:hypothetical protein